MNQKRYFLKGKLLLKILLLGKTVGQPKLSF